MKLNELISELNNKKFRSAWDKGVNEYALELCEELEYSMNYEELEEVPTSIKILDKMLLNGASDWHQYSWGGCSLIYDGDIAKRLCSPSELKKCHEGSRKPNAREDWLDVQARALRQASLRIKKFACYDSLVK